MPEPSPPPGAVLLTGATGFVGSRLQNHLLGNGFKVRALVRHGSPRAGRLDARVERVEGALDNAQALARGLAGTRAVIHCAGAVRGRDWDDFVGVNVEGVRSLANAMKRLSSPPALLHVSSLAATQPGLSSYARSKREGERLLEDYLELLWTVMRPPAIYGPGDVEMKPLLGLVRRGVVPVAGGEHGQRLSLLHVDDLCTAVLAWLKAPARHRHYCYELDDGHPHGYSYPEIIDAVCTQPLFRRPLIIPLPIGLLTAVARTNEALCALIGRAPMLTRGKVREFIHADWVCDNTAFSGTSGWRPAIRLADGAARLFESA